MDGPSMDAKNAKNPLVDRVAAAMLMINDRRLEVSDSEIREFSAVVSRSNLDSLFIWAPIQFGLMPYRQSN